jgi:hypothetical protein
MIGVSYLRFKISKVQVKKGKAIPAAGCGGLRRHET